MNVSAQYDVVVVGGGVIGLSCAWQAAEQGLSVAVVDPAPAIGASTAAAGMLAPVTEVHYGEEPLLRLNLAAADRYPSFVAELESRTGVSVGYRTCGTLAVALDAGDRAALDEVAAFQRSLGLEVQSLTGTECRRLEPFLAPGVRGGVLVSGDHQVDNRRLLAALLLACELSGVTAVRQRVSSVRTSSDSVRGVVLDDGTALEAGAVVLAAGARSGLVEGVPPSAVPPVRPVKGQILRLWVPSSSRPFLSRNVRGTVRGFGVYLVPREDGEMVVGATVEELGFDEQATAGGTYELLREAHALVPGITELALVETMARSRPGSADNAPIVGMSCVPGLVVATGHYRNGILLAPVTADAVVQVLADGSLPQVMAPFSPARFARDPMPV